MRFPDDFPMKSPIGLKVSLMGLKVSLRTSAHFSASVRSLGFAFTLVSLSELYIELRAYFAAGVSSERCASDAERLSDGMNV